MTNDVLTIRAPEENAGRVCTATYTRFFVGDREVKNVARCEVVYAPDAIITAKLELAISPDEDITALPLLGLDTVKEAARHYGYTLTPPDKPTPPPGRNFCELCGELPDGARHRNILCRISAWLNARKRT